MKDMVLRAFLKRLGDGVPMLPARVLNWGSRMPAPLRNALVEQIFNYALRKPLAAGTFDFLSDQAVSVVASDADYGISLTCHKRLLRLLPSGCADTTITASTLDLLRMAAGQVDADSLFFRQQLTIRGNVALGLETKNALDGIDRDDLPFPVWSVLRGAETLFRRMEQTR